MKTIAVIDYGMGNLRSVAKAMEHVAPSGTRVRVTSAPEEIASAERIVFPGQGAARDCMRALREHELVEPVLQAARSKPFLGICMGMQVLVGFSEENGGTECLGFYDGTVRYFGEDLSDPVSGQLLKIPHMGWNEVQQTRIHPLWKGIAQNSRFYFVHSYYVDPAEADLDVGVTDYGRRFVSAIARDNVFAIQCHPEKSADAGLRLLSNFAHWDGAP